MASYAAPADLLARYDARVIGDLAGDDGEQVSAGDLTSDDNVLAALADASGEIDAALLRGNRYTTADLAALTGNSLAFLKRICCQIAIARLWERRVTLEMGQEIAAEQAAEQARKALERLRRGEEVFDIQTAKDAGLPSLSLPSRVNIENRNLLVDECRGKFYPVSRTKRFGE